MTPSEVKARLRAAADCDRRMFVANLRPAGLHSAWPDIEMSKADLYALAVEEEAKPLAERMKNSMCEPVPTPNEITLMDEALGEWPLLIDDIKIRRCVVAWAHNINRRLIAAKAGTSRRTAMRLVEHGIITISLALKKCKAA